MNPDLLQFSPGAYLAPAVDWLNKNFHPFFDAVTKLIEAVLGAIETALLYPPPSFSPRSSSASGSRW
jgi:glycine betaine/proline transport system permease protein